MPQSLADGFGARVDNAGIRLGKKYAVVQEGQESPVETTFSTANTSTQSTSPESALLALFDLLSLVHLFIPYIFHPITGLQVYFPKMWPFSTAFDPSTAIPSLSGKVILVTGGNIGLGKETILQLAKHNPSHIYMASRTESKALAAIKDIRSELPEWASAVPISFLPLDLSSLKSVKAAATKFLSESTRLDLLILNAGIMATPPGTSESGHDIQLGTNHFGHFLLTKLLLPTLQKTAAEPNADVRVITVASDAFNISPTIDVITSIEKLTAKGPWVRYGASKAANILFAAEFARRYPDVKAVSLHPGLIRTQLFERSSGGVMKMVFNIIQPLMFTDVAHGALNSLWLAAGAERGELKDGSYYTPVGKAQSNKWANDQAAGKTLWEWTESELAKSGY